MSAVQPRLRMFAGPNGSGKSTLKDELLPHWLGIYVNADDIEAEIHAHGCLHLSPLGVATTEAELLAFLASSTLLKQAGLADSSQQIRLQGDRVDFGPVAVNSYHASVLVDFIRHDLLRRKVSFTFETVMSGLSLCRRRDAAKARPTQLQSPDEAAMNR